MTADDQHRGDVRQVVGDRVEDRHEIGPDDQDLGLGVVDDVLDLGGGQTPVDVDAHGVDHRRTEHHLEVFEAVLVEERDAFLLADSRSQQALRGPSRAVSQLRPSERSIAQDQCGLVTLRFSVNANDPRQIRDVPHGPAT